MSMTTTELAETLETTPRTLRKFLRSQDMGVGKGSRYALPSTKREVNKIAKAFAAWDEARTAPADDAPVEAPAEPEMIDDETPALEDMTHPLDA